MGDIITSLPYEQMQVLYDKNFSLQYLGTNISNKFALISLTCYITEKLKQKKPDVTHWSVLYKINKSATPPVSEDYLKRLAVLCWDFSYGCKEFLTFDLKDKDIPNKIRDLLSEWSPF